MSDTITKVRKYADSIESSLNKLDDEFLSPSEYFKIVTDLQAFSEKLCLVARMLPIETGSIHAADEVRYIITNEAGINIKHTNDNITTITLPTLLPKKEKGSVVYIRDSLIISIQSYMESHERIHYSEPVVLVYHHIYDKSNKGKRNMRDHDNFEINAVTDVLAMYFLDDDSPILCQSFHYSTYGAVNSTEIFIVPKTKFSRWVATNYAD